MLIRTIFFMLVINTIHGMETFNLDLESSHLSLFNIDPTSSYTGELLASGISNPESINLNIPEPINKGSLALSYIFINYTSPNLICSECDLRFMSAKSLKSHFIQKHHPIKKILCPHVDCDKSYIKFINLQRHLRIEHLQKNFICECGKQFSTKSKYAKHFRLHTGIPLYQIKNENKECNICAKRFTTVKAHDLHVKYAHEITQIFMCPYECSNQYTNRKALNLHMLRNHKEPIFFCKYCDVKFTMQCDLNQHYKRTHKKLKEQNCVVGQ